MEHLQKLGIIGLVNLLVYWKTIYYGYVGDDVERSQRQEPVFKNAWHRRWIQFIGLRHLNPMVAHFITIITHTVCCMMIYLALGRNNLSFLTALIFSINPMNIQGSVWISGRNYVVSSIFCLLMLTFPKVSWLFYTVTSHFAVNAWFAPLAFLGTPYWYMVGIIPIIWLITTNNKSTLHRKLWETGGLKTTNTEMRAIKIQKIIPFVKTFIYYLSLGIIPYKSGIEHNFLRGFGTNKTDNEKGYKMDWVFWCGFIAFLAITTSSIYCIFNGWTPLVWGLFWFTINIAMWCNFVTYQQQIAERYTYLANIGLMYALASIIISYPVVIAVFLTGYLVRLWFVMDTYLNDWWAVEYAIKEFKNLSYMWLIRGVKKFCEGDQRGALKDFNEAYTHKPYDLKVLFNMATTCFVLGDVVQARNFLTKARENVYDELEQDVKPAFDKLEMIIKQVEEAKARGEMQVQVDMANIMVVK